MESSDDRISSLSASQIAAGQNWIAIVLFTAQGAAIAIMTWLLLPVFWGIVANLGSAQDISFGKKVTLVLAAIVFQFCYWSGYERLKLWQTGNLFASHLLLFAARLSFIFASTLCSIVLFRHLPGFVSPLDLVESGLRLVVFGAVVFSMFCYALQIENFGKARASETPKDAEKRNSDTR
jgi:hypothetical protein